MPEMPEFDIPAFDVVVHSSVRGGLMVENLTPQLGEYFGVKEGHGVLVRSVEKGSPAEYAGFRAGDVVVRVGTEPVTDTSDWRRAMRASRTEKGAVRIGIVRERKSQTLSFTPPKQTGKATALEIKPSEISAELDLNGLRIDMKRLRPEIERASLEARKMQRELLQHRVEWEREARKATRELQRQLRLNQRDIQKSVDDSLRSLKGFEDL
jgi:membrane-associated protease RseP (regulator of RpoE activity)